jgi:hypothetical protein
LAGKQVAHYRVLEKLGESGMGVVYKARDTHLDRFVAIEVLPAERVASAERKSRFVQEAKAASALNHPNIITIYDIGADAGRDFIAMEYVAGKTLDQLTPRQGMRLNGFLSPWPTSHGPIRQYAGNQVHFSAARSHFSTAAQIDRRTGPLLRSGTCAFSLLSWCWRVWSGGRSRRCAPRSGPGRKP